MTSVQAKQASKPQPAPLRCPKHIHRTKASGKNSPLLPLQPSCSRPQLPVWTRTLLKGGGGQPSHQQTPPLPGETNDIFTPMGTHASGLVLRVAEHLARELAVETFSKVVRKRTVRSATPPPQSREQGAQAPSSHSKAPACGGPLVQCVRACALASCIPFCVCVIFFFGGGSSVLCAGIAHAWCGRRSTLRQRPNALQQRRECGTFLSPSLFSLALLSHRFAPQPLPESQASEVGGGGPSQSDAAAARPSVVAQRASRWRTPLPPQVTEHGPHIETT